jgi:hypothetical protein
VVGKVQMHPYLGVGRRDLPLSYRGEVCHNVSL